MKIADRLKNNTYPGRGIILGRSQNGRSAVIAYFIMGRSENSRNRIFVEQSDGIRTQAFDPKKLSDPSLVIYAPVRVLSTSDHDKTIVTNGDQTETICQMLKGGYSFEEALRTRTFEPDPPIYTPRISGILEGFDYKLSILKSAEYEGEKKPKSVQRYFFEYDTPIAGQGHLIHTYRCDGDPVPSFDGEPKSVIIGNDLDEFTSEIWENLNDEKKVSLFTRFINVKTGETKTRIINRLIRA